MKNIIYSSLIFALCCFIVLGSIKLNSDADIIYMSEMISQKIESKIRKERFLNFQKEKSLILQNEQLKKQLEEKDLLMKDMQESIDVLTFQIHDLVDKHKVGIEKRRRLLIEGKSYFAF